MNDPIHRELAVFSAARRLPASERAGYLEEACADDAALRQRIEELLRAGEEAEGFLQHPAPGAKRPADVLTASNTRQHTEAPGERAGDRIGRYRLLQQIGAGGCGVVYMAEQEEPVRRRVALKVIKLGMDTKQVIARFEAERQALALMDHPNIAKVLDAGATVTGRPYFVMELVRGIKITQYCDENKISTAERLDLFTKVSQAVQHAHQKGIIHRDIKPSNILVADHDGVPVPKVIDFGIAKATTDQRLTDKTLFTAFEQFIGTPAYMSPEQARMSGMDIDTRTDIYSLGVLLYELLTSKTPFDAQDLLSAGLDAMRRTISEKEPARPSTRLSTMLEGELTTTAKHRDTDAPRLIHLVRGDLDWIVMKCLEKDRTRRYETANGLAMDVQRYLTDEPIVARPPGNFYRFQKLVRRNRLAFAAATIISAVLVLGVVVSTSEAIRATRAEREQSRLREAAQRAQATEAQLRQKAEADERKAATEAAKATAVSEFLQEMLRSANPDDVKGSDYTVRQLLDDFSGGLAKQLAGQPEVEATVRATMGNAYSRLGLTGKAEPHLAQALALQRRIYGEQSGEFAQSLVDHAWNLFEQERLPEAESEARRGLDIYRKGGTAPQLVIHALWVLELSLGSQERFNEMEAAFEEALAIARNSPGREFPEIANMMGDLAAAEVKEGKYSDAERLALQAVEIQRRLLGPEHPETGWSLLEVGAALKGQHKLPEAERALNEALAIFRKCYPTQHKSIRTAIAQLSEVLEAKGDSAGLEALSRQQMTGPSAVLGIDVPAVAEVSSSSLAASLYAQGKKAEAHTVAREAQQRCHIASLQYEKLTSDPNRHNQCWSFAISYEALGLQLKQMGDIQEAEEAYRDVQVLWRNFLANSNTEDHRFHLAVNCDALGNLLRGAGRASESLEAYLNAQAIWVKLVTDFNMEDRRMHLASTDENIGQLLMEAGHFNEATAVYREALAVWKKLITEFNKDFYRDHLSGTLVGLATTLQAEGMRTGAKAPFGEAESAIREDLALRKQRFGDVHREVGVSLLSLARVLQQEGELAEAKAVWREELEMATKLSSDEHPFAANSLQAPANALREQGKLPEAEAVCRQELALEKRLSGSVDPKVACSLHLLADILYDQAKWAEAEAVCREAIASFKQLEQDDRKRSDFAIQLGHSQWRLAAVLSKTNRRDQAEPILREAVQIFEQAARDFPAELFLRQEEAFSRRSLADLLNGLGRVDEAERENRAAIAVYAALKEAAPRNAFYYQEEAYSTWILATVLEGASRLDAAEAEYGNAIALYEKGSADFPNQAMFTEGLGPLKLRLVELLRRREGPRRSPSDERPTNPGALLGK